MSHNLAAAYLCTGLALSILLADTASQLFLHRVSEEGSEFLFDLGVVFGRAKQCPHTGHEASQHVSPLSDFEYPVDSRGVAAPLAAFLFQVLQALRQSACNVSPGKHSRSPARGEALFRTCAS